MAPTALLHRRTPTAAPARSAANRRAQAPRTWRSHPTPRKPRFRLAPQTPGGIAANPIRASAGVITDWIWTRASRSGCNAADTSSALARARTTGCWFAPLMAVEAVAMSAIAPRVSTPAARTDASASVRFFRTSRSIRAPAGDRFARPTGLQRPGGGRGLRGGHRFPVRIAATLRRSGRASPARVQDRSQDPRARQAGKRPATVQCRRACASPCFLPARRGHRVSCLNPKHTRLLRCIPRTCAGRVVSVNMLFIHG